MNLRPALVALGFVSFELAWAQRPAIPDNNPVNTLESREFSATRRMPGGTGWPHLARDPLRAKVVRILCDDGPAKRAPRPTFSASFMYEACPRATNVAVLPEGIGVGFNDQVPYMVVWNGKIRIQCGQGYVVMPVFYRRDADDYTCFPLGPRTTQPQIQ